MKQVSMLDVAHRIVAEAKACLLAVGVRCLNLDRLAATLRTSKKTICQHFPTRAALLERVFQRYQQQAGVQHQLFQRVLTAREELQLLLRWFKEQHLALPPGFLPELARTNALRAMAAVSDYQPGAAYRAKFAARADRRCIPPLGYPGT